MPAAAGTAGAGSRGGRRENRGHGAPRRFGRIGVFVALATVLSAGTAAALVLSSGGQNPPVSLPAGNGNIPISSQSASPPGVIALPSSTVSGSPSASASPSPSASTRHAVPPPPPASSGSPSASQTSASASPSPDGSSQNSGSPAPALAFPLYWGITGENAEVTEVQQMLADLSYLQLESGGYDISRAPHWMSPDPVGVYAQATYTAVTRFQEDSQGLDVSGDVDQATFTALEQATSSGNGN
jgi:hypothetical protein